MLVAKFTYEKQVNVCLFSFFLHLFTLLLGTSEIHWLAVVKQKWRNIGGRDEL